MTKDILTKLHTLLFIIVMGVVAADSAFASATITIQNDDPAGVGFNDTTATAGVGGNNGQTLGEQRLNAFMFAASIWGATLNSGPTITIRASWPALTPCTATSGVIGSAGSIGIERDFANAPFANTWYSDSLSNALAGTDLDPSTPEIRARFNVNVGTPGCLATSPWYLGLDGNHGNGIDLVAVLLHEFGHGLGFQTFTREDTGAFAAGFPSIFDKFLFDSTTNKTWEQMTPAERVSSATNKFHLTWNGNRVMADIPSVLNLGTPRVVVNSPLEIAGDYSFGTADFGPALSSPGVTGNVSQSSPSDGCSAVANLSGKIALIDRGTCTFVAKTKNAQNAGALGVIIVNNVAGPPPSMGGSDPTIAIPTVSISQSDGNLIKAQLGNNVTVNLFFDSSLRAGADSSGRMLMYAPNPLESGSSVSHFDISAFPNQLMEPNNSDGIAHSVVVPQDLTFSLFRDLGWTGGAVVSSTIQFTSSSFGAFESIGSMAVSVGRTGDTSAASTVEYTTSDTAGTSACNVSSGVASSRCDYVQTVGRLTFAPGETTKTILVPIIDDVFVDGPTETFNITLSNPTNGTLGTANATLSINDNDSSLGVNPIDDVDFFVRQQYIDFLNREPDTAGFNFWKNEITSCLGNAQCIEVKRINVSAAFFLSIEFQQTGYFVERVYKTAYGDAIGNSTLGGAHQLSVPTIRLNEFLADKQQIGDGVVVGQPGWEGLLDTRKNLYLADFVQRNRFTTAFPAGMTPTTFVTTLNNNAGNPLSPGEQTNLINELTSGAKTRAQVLRAVAEDSDLVNAEKNRAFVLAQFFGYLRRNPNDLPDSDYTGYDFWLAKLNQFNGNFVNAEMVKAFIQSVEYRHRFGP